MQLGDPIGISPRDMDKVHLDVIEQQINQAVPGVMAKARSGSPDLESILNNLKLLAAHTQAHIQSWQAKSGKTAGEEIAPYVQKAQAFGNVLKQGEAQLQRFRTQQAKQQQDMQAQAMQAQQQQLPTGISPEDMAGAPAGVAPHMLKIATSIDYKSAPEDIKRQIEAAAGFVPSRMGAAGAPGQPQAQPPQPPSPPVGFPGPAAAAQVPAGV